MGSPVVLLTGCAGYIGSVLTDNLLDAGCRVIGIDALIYQNKHSVLPYLGNKNFEFHCTDIIGHDIQQLVKRADVVITLAALVGAPICEKYPALAYYYNYKSINYLVEHLSSHQRLIYVNTNSGYGATSGIEEATENTPLLPISVYAKTKADAEKIVLERDNAVSLRLATVFGPSPRMRFDLMVNDFTERLYRIKQTCIRDEHDRCMSTKPPFTIYEPHFRRNFVHIQDVCRAFLFMMGKPHLNGVYNVGLPSANLTKMELAHTICDVIGLDKELVSTGEGKDLDQRNYLVSNEKLLRTGFEFSRTLEQGINEVNSVCQLFDEHETIKMRNV